MTDEEVDAQFTVFAIMLAAPFFNGDHGELALDVRHDIQAILWRHGYVPAQQMLFENGATQVQVECARLAKSRYSGSWSLMKLVRARIPKRPTTVYGGSIAT